MTILLAALCAVSSASPAVSIHAAGSERIDRRLVAIRVVRDLDRDGVQDLCLRSCAAGRAEIAAISAARGSVLWRADGPEGVVDWTGAPLPGALAPLGDHDGDGYGEVAALWRDTDASGEQRGVVLAVHAGTDGRVLRAIELTRGAMEPHATTLAATGDLDGDLLPDLIVLAPAREPFAGRIRAVSSASGAELWSTATTARGDGHGTSIAQLRDLDADGIVDSALVVAEGIDVLSGRDGRLVKRIERGVFDLCEMPAESAIEASRAAHDDRRDVQADIASPSASPAVLDAAYAALDALADADSALRGLVGEPAHVHAAVSNAAEHADVEVHASGPGAAARATEPRATDSRATDSRVTGPGATDSGANVRTADVLATASSANFATVADSRHWLASGSLVVMGDLDGDAVLDLFVPQRVSAGHATSGALVSVGKSRLVTRRELPVWSLELGSAGFRAAGDLDGDKRIDVLCADAGWNSPGAGRSGVDVGAVRVLAGSDGREVRAWHGGSTLTRLGEFTAIAGDVDRDGVNDVWMSAMDTSSRPHEVLALASGATGRFLRWIDLGRIAAEHTP